MRFTRTNIKKTLHNNVLAIGGVLSSKEEFRFFDSVSFD